MIVYSGIISKFLEWWARIKLWIGDIETIIVKEKINIKCHNFHTFCIRFALSFGSISSSALNFNNIAIIITIITTITIINTIF